MECVGCELSIGSLTSRLPGGRRLELIIITVIISNAGPDAQSGGGLAHPTGTWGTWLVRRRRTVWRPKGRFFRRWGTICWLSLSDLISSTLFGDDTAQFRSRLMFYETSREAQSILEMLLIGRFSATTFTLRNLNMPVVLNLHKLWATKITWHTSTFPQT